MEVAKKLEKDKERLKAIKHERKLIEFPGIKQEHIAAGDAFINDEDYIHYTLINTRKSEDMETLVLIHGFGGSNNIFFRMMKPLSEFFRIISIDLPGMALSSRFDSEKRFKDTKSCVHFFVEQINAFFNRIKLHCFYLVAHSIGAFFATHYFDRYSFKVKKLILLSPAGFNPSTPQTEKQINNMLEKMGWFKRSAIKYMGKKIFEEKKSPFEAIWLPKGMFLKTYFGSKRYNFSEKEMKLLIKYNSYIMSLPQSGERCLGYILADGIKSKLPLIDVLDGMKTRSRDIKIFYGENDWMDDDEAKKNMKLRGLDIEVNYISKSDHQIINQNAEETAACIIDECTK